MTNGTKLFFYEISVKALEILIILRCVAEEINAKLALIRHTEGFTSVFNCVLSLKSLVITYDGLWV